MNSMRKISFYPFIIIGCLAGILLAFTAPTSKNVVDILPWLNNSHPGNFLYRPFINTWISFYGLFFLLAWPEKKSLSRLIIFTFIPSALASLLGMYSANSIAQENLLCWYVISLTAFHIHFQIRGFDWDYPTLFRAVWDSMVKIIIAFFFTLLCWILIFICKELLEVVEIRWIGHLINLVWFDILISTIFFSIGLWIATQAENVAHTIRNILLIICRYLLVPLSIIGLFFVIVAAMPIHHTFALRNAFVFTSMAFLAVILTNGAYQDGRNERIYPPFLRWICSIFLLITPLFPLIKLFVLYYAPRHINMQMHYFSYVNTFILLAYTLCYAVIAIHRKGPWLKSMEKANIGLGIIVVITIFCVMNPIVLQHLSRYNEQTKVIQPIQRT